MSPTPTYLTEVAAYNRQPTLLVRIDITATAGSPPTPTFRFNFSLKEAKPINLLLGKDVRPYLISSRGRPTRISSERALTERSSITLKFVDDENPPDFDSAFFTVTKGLSFWKRLTAAQPNLIGSPVEVLRGFNAVGFVEAEFKTIFKGRLDDIDFAPDGSVSITAKDKLTFVDRQVPNEISDANITTIALATTVSFTVSTPSEITDPASLASRDYYPIILRIDPDSAKEDIIIRNISSGTIFVQDNHVDKSEDFSSSPWSNVATATVTTNQDVGPFGGPATADVLNLPAANDAVEQLTAASATAAGFVFSIWLRKNRLVPTSTGITLELTDGTTTATKTISVVPSSWRRFEVSGTFTGTLTVRIKRVGSQDNKVVAFGGSLGESLTTWTDEDANSNVRGFYVGTDGNPGADAGRGAFESTAAGHTAIAFREVLIYRSHLAPGDGVHPIFIARDLVNRGGLANDEVDLPTFDREFEFQETIQFKRSGTAIIDRPKNLLKHVKEIREQALVDLWISEEGKVKVKFSWRINIPGQTTFEITDADNIVFRSSSYRGNAESRVTRVFLYYNVNSGAEGNKPADFANVNVILDASAETVAGPKSKVIFSLWIFRAAEASAAAGRIVSRFKRGARLAKWAFELKEDRDFFTGDFIILNSRDIPLTPSDTAVQGSTNWQVTQKDPKHIDGVINVEALEGRGLRYAIISPAVIGKNDPFTGVPGVFPLDFDDATEDDKQYGFIGDANNLVGTNKEQGYFIL